MSRLRQETVMAKHQVRKQYARAKRRHNDRASIDEQVDELCPGNDWTHFGAGLWECDDCGGYSLYFLPHVPGQSR